MSLAFRISCALLVLGGGISIYFARTEIERTERRYREATEEPLVDFAYTLAAVAAVESEAKGVLSVDSLRAAAARALEEDPAARIYGLEKRSIDLRIYVTDSRGTIAFDSDGGRDEGRDYSRWNDVARALRGEYGARTSRESPEGPSTLYVAAPIRSGGRIIGTLTVAKPNANANLLIRAAQRSTATLVATFFIVVAIAMVAAVAVFTRPLEALTAYARRVRDGERAKLPRLPAGEIRTLGAAFEEMREALEGKNHVERYVKTLTHELKSPLTSIRGAAELLGEEMPPEDRHRFVRNIESEAARIEVLVDQLKALTSLQAPRTELPHEEIRIAPLLSEVLERVESSAEKRSVGIDVSCLEDLVLSANRFWLEEAVLALVRNAVDFSPRGGRVSLTANREPETIRIAVDDNGPGIPEWARGKVFDQFFSLPRPDTGRRSSGLGLPIVKEIADLHGGAVTVESGPAGGTRAAIVIPRRHHGDNDR